MRCSQESPLWQSAAYGCDARRERGQRTKLAVQVVENDRQSCNHRASFACLGDAMDDEADDSPAKARLRTLSWEIATTEGQIVGVVQTGQNVPVRAGFVAEEVHAGTFNCDAVVKEQTVRARTDRHSDFGNTGYTRNGVSDIGFVDVSITPEPGQVKFHKTAEDTAKALRELTADKSQKYAGHQLIVPADQLDDVRDAAHRTYLKETDGRQDVRAAAEMVGQKATDRLRVGLVESAPLSLGTSKAIVLEPHGEERRALEEPYVRAVLSPVRDEALVAGQTFDPQGLLRGDDVDRLINNGRVDDVGSAMDQDGYVTLTYEYRSSDPDLSEEQRDHHETTRDFIRVVATKMEAEVMEVNDGGDDDDGIEDDEDE